MNKQEKIARALELTWGSLESHLCGTHHKVTAAEKKGGESNAFHKKCCKEYAEVIKILCDLL